MRGNIAQLMQQAQRMQDNLQRAQEDIAKLAKALAKYDLLKLKSEGKAGANPHVVTIKFGKAETTLTLGAGVKLPDVDPNAKELAMGQRYTGIVETLHGLTAKK